jgi:hypothetical protein
LTVATVPVSEENERMADSRSMHVLLVIDGNPDNNWYRVFKGLKGTAHTSVILEFFCFS